MEPQISREELGEGVVLTTEMRSKPLEYLYTVENQFPEELHFTFDFTGSKNVRIEGSVGSDNHLKTMITIKPKSTSKTVIVRRQDIESNAKIALQTHWEFEEIDAETVRILESTWDKSIQSLLDTTPVGYEPSEDRLAIEQRCPIEGFLDINFPPFSSTLYKPSEDEQGDWGVLTYRRIPQFVQGTGKVFGDSCDVQDIQMGVLPDCWLVSSLAALFEVTCTPNLIKTLFENGTGEYSETGVYKINLFKNGEWVTVVVDDYIPCFMNGDPAYSSSKSGLLWIILVEKAFAKLHGNYQALPIGTAYEAMIDLTGAPTFCLHFDTEDAKEAVEDGSLWKKLCLYEAKGHVMTLSVGLEAEEEPSGLQSGHAFGIKALKTTKKGRLVLLSDPWKVLHWTGDWSTGSSLWTAELRKDVGAVDNNDSLVWMAFEDAVRFFACVNVCLIRRSINKVAPWHTASGKFRYTYNEEDCSVDAPAFVVTCKADSSVHFTVHQVDEHIKGASAYIDIGVTILRDDGGDLSLVGSCGNTAERQNMVTVELEKETKYIVVPTSGGCKFKQQTVLSSGATAGLSRDCVVFAHGEAELTWASYVCSKPVNDKAMELALLGGTANDIVEDALQMLSLRGGNAGVAFAALNSSTSKVRLTTDFATDSVNIFSHRGNLINSVIIPPGEMRILQHICPLNEKDSWEAVWDCKVLFYDDEVEEAVEAVVPLTPEVMPNSNRSSTKSHDTTQPVAVSSKPNEDSAEVAGSSKSVKSPGSVKTAAHATESVQTPPGTQDNAALGVSQQCRCAIM